MAKRAHTKNDLITKTDTGEEKDPITSSGLGLRQSEWAELERIAAELGINRHALTVYAVRYFMAQYKAGAIKAEKKYVLTLPST
jgi:hypothetical protein